MTCKDCIFYTVDTDRKGHVTVFHHDPTQPEGFCVLRDLFYNVTAETKPCKDFVKDIEP